ncbi:MAG TPA: OmpA family protein [Ferruginibacter sp.]|jgi:chemotaxis protein MotB|nr:OmpA family protein [Ferruginibacter sp.]
MRIKNLALTGLLPILLFSCVSTKKFKASQAKYDELNKLYAGVAKDLRSCDSNLIAKGKIDDSTINDLDQQIAALKGNNNQAIQQLQDMSVLTGAQAQSIQNSLDSLGAKDSYIHDLQSALARKDSLNATLVENLKGVIGNLNDKDINVKIDKGVIYIDISDKLLFKSGSYDVTEKANAILGKVALVLKNQPNIDFMVEGHTDNKPFKKGVLLDNWDLSVKRATSVVRILEHKYGLPAARISASGRSEYLPVASNGTDEGRAQNRRTRIIILPQLDQFFKLLQKK